MRPWVGAAFKSVASAKFLVGVMVAVVVAFVAATAVSQYVESKSAKQTEDIIGNAMPSIQELALVRGALRNIDRLISRRHPGDHVSSEIVENRRNIDAALASYVALPFFPGEQDMYAPVPNLLRQLDREIVVDVGLDDAALEQCRDTIDTIDQVIQRIVTYDAAQGQRLGLSIAEARGRSRVVSARPSPSDVVQGACGGRTAYRNPRCRCSWDPQ